MTYDNGGYTISNMDAVMAHETGHIFGAGDQYVSYYYNPPVICSCTAIYGFLQVENQNCENSCLSNVASIMRGGVAPYTAGAIDYYAKGQIGWRDLDSDSINDVVDSTYNTDSDFDGDGIVDYWDDDNDNDGVVDTSDNCPLTSNPSQTDTDGDGQGDACDTDDDNDGVVDTSDNCPLTSNPSQTDTDGDGQGDACDTDDDNDGILDINDNCPNEPGPSCNNGCPVTTIWVLNTTWSECDITDYQYRNYYDNSTCSDNSTPPNPINQTCDYCEYNLVNTSWTEWQNQGSCLINNTQIQNRSKTEYDSNYTTCYAVTNLSSDLWVNITHWDYNYSTCDYCTPIWTLNNTWDNCQIEDIQYKNYYDYNSCYSQTGLASDLDGKPSNTNQSCDYCTPNWIGINTNFQLNDEIVEWYNDTNDCYALTGLDSDLMGKPAFTNLSFSKNNTLTVYLKIPKITIVSLATLSLKGYNYSSCTGWNFTYTFPNSTDCIGWEYIPSDSPWGAYRAGVIIGWETYMGYVNVEDNYLMQWTVPIGDRNFIEYGRCRQYEMDKGVCSETELNPFNQTFPISPSIDIGHDSNYEWVHSGSFVNATITPDLSNPVNNYLSSCEANNEGYCSIPIFFESQSMGNIELSINLNYCTPNWIGINTSCKLNDEIVEWYNDTNDCHVFSNLSSDMGWKPTNVSYGCDYCTPNWQCTDYDVCQPNDRKQCNQTTDSNNCYAQTGLNSDLYSGNYLEFKGYCDYDNNNIIGNLSTVNTTLENFSITIGNLTNLSALFNATATVVFKEANITVVEFDFNFSKQSLNFLNITIEKQSNTSTKGSLRITGIDLTSQGETKTGYMDRIDTNANRVCVVDADILTISAISSNCDGAGEVPLTCDGTLQGAYTCTLIGSKYKIEGLNHSAAVEYTYSNGGNGGGAEAGGGGGGGGGGSPEIQEEVPIVEEVITPILLPPRKKAVELYAEETTEEAKDDVISEEKEKRKGLFGITGAVIGNAISGTNHFVGIIVILSIVFIGSVWFYKKKPKKRKKKRKKK